MSKYYAVAVGHNPGIYRTWKEASANVSGFPGAMHKSFPTENQAIKYLYDNGVSSKIINKYTSNKSPLTDNKPFNKSSPIDNKPFNKSPFTNNLSNKKHFKPPHSEVPITIYTDGSHSNFLGGYGIVVLYYGVETLRMSGPIPEEKTTSQRAELYAIYMVMYNINYIISAYETKYNRKIQNIIIKSDSMYSINCFTKW